MEELGFLVCAANVNNCKPTRPPLGGHREVGKTWYILRK